MEDRGVHFWAHMLDGALGKHMLSEGKHWPEDYLKTAFNYLKASNINYTSDEQINADLQKVLEKFT